MGTSAPIADHWLSLSQSRCTKFAVWGKADGVPVIHCHGSPGSRLERYPNSDQTAASGIRLITMDRPGYGYATPVGRRPLNEFADDVVALADHLGLDSFYVHGFSGGAPYVLAIAACLRDRVRGAAVLAGIGPLDRPGAFDGMSTDNVEEYRVARETPDQLAAYLAAQAGKSGLPDTELEALAAASALLDVMLEGAPESTRQGHAGVICDDLTLVSPWGFELSAITAPLHLWHGELDTLVPLHHAEYVAALVPCATLHRCEGKGHFDMFGLQASVLETLLAEGRDADATPGLPGS